MFTHVKYNQNNLPLIGGYNMLVEVAIQVRHVHTLYNIITHNLPLIGVYNMLVEVAIQVRHVHTW